MLPYETKQLPAANRLQKQWGSIRRKHSVRLQHLSRMNDVSFCSSFKPKRIWLCLGTPTKWWNLIAEKQNTNYGMSFFTITSIHFDSSLLNPLFLNIQYCCCLLVRQFLLKKIRQIFFKDWHLVWESFWWKKNWQVCPPTTRMKKKFNEMGFATKRLNLKFEVWKVNSGRSKLKPSWFFNSMSKFLWTFGLNNLLFKLSIKKSYWRRS